MKVSEVRAAFMAMDQDLAEDLGNSFELVGADNVDVRDREAAWAIIKDDAASLAMVDRILRPSEAEQSRRAREQKAEDERRALVGVKPSAAPKPAPKAEEGGVDLADVYKTSIRDGSMRVEK